MADSDGWIKRKADISDAPLGGKELVALVAGRIDPIKVALLRGD